MKNVASGILSALQQTSNVFWSLCSHDVRKEEAPRSFHQQDVLRSLPSFWFLASRSRPPPMSLCIVRWRRPPAREGTCPSHSAAPGGAPRCPSCRSPALPTAPCTSCFSWSGSSTSTRSTAASSIAQSSSVRRSLTSWWLRSRTPWSSPPPRCPARLSGSSSSGTWSREAGSRHQDSDPETTRSSGSGGRADPQLGR